MWNSRHAWINPNIESYHNLHTYLNKDSSAWPEVWTATCPSWSSIMGPGPIEALVQQNTELSP